jgi:hypothetical protein
VPNKPLQLTPLCGRKIGAILESGSSPSAFPLYHRGATERQSVGLLQVAHRRGYKIDVAKPSCDVSYDDFFRRNRYSMPSLLPEPPPAAHRPRRVYQLFVALVVVLFLSCMAAFLIPFGLSVAYSRLVGPYFVGEFPVNFLQALLIIPVLFIGASIGATLTQLIRWRIAHTTEASWYPGLGVVIIGWGIASAVLPIMMIPLRFNREQPLLGAVFLTLIGACTGSLIAQRQQQPLLSTSVSQDMWIAAMAVAWGLAWAWVPNAIQVVFGRL